MFLASLCPSSGEQDCVLLHVMFCTGCAGCGCVQLGRKLCEGYCSTSHSAHSLQPSSTQPVQNITCSNTRSCYPDDGHNDAQNMLRYKFDNKHRISCILLVYLSSPYIP